MSQSPVRQMIEKQLRPRGIHDERVIEAMLGIPREEFIPKAERHLAYSDAALPIHCEQTITQPYMTALMAQSLNLQGTENVLDVGTGSGYHVALLGRLARRVVSIERIPELAAEARATLERLGLGSNVTILCGDGSLGYPMESPFDAISVAAASPSVPQALIEQLRDPGALVIPVGDRDSQDLQLILKRDGTRTARTITGCRFVPLIGEAAWSQ